MRDTSQEPGSTGRAQLLLRSGPVNPEAVLFDNDLSSEEKRWVLRQLIEDLAAELRASEENMTGARSGDAGEQLRVAHEALASIR